MDVGTVSVNGRDLFHIDSPRRIRQEAPPLTTLSERKEEAEHPNTEMTDDKRSFSAEAKQVAPSVSTCV